MIIIEDDRLESVLSSVESVLHATLESGRLAQEWYDMEACFRLRGAGSFSTFRNKRWYQPMGGIPDAHIQGRRVWGRATVLEWLSQTDETLDEYHRRHRTGARP